MEKHQSKILDFDSIRLRLASPEVIKSWSHGEVTKPETINYRTQKPEKGGLFAEEIFGPSKDWECYCGKYRKIRYRGIVCDKCGVEVTTALVRRERMGHIDLAAPVSHIWFLRGVPSKLGLILDISLQNLEKVIYFNAFVILAVNEGARGAALEELQNEFKSKRKQIENEYAREAERLAALGLDEKKKKTLDQLATVRDRKLNELEKDFQLVGKELREIAPLKIISETTFQEWSLKYGHIFTAGIGAEAIRDLLSRIDFSKITKDLEVELPSSQGAKRERLIRRIKLLKSLSKNGINPVWMILATIPVVPPDLRPMVALDGGRFATSDLNDLYRRVINRNNRLKRLRELNAPEVITRNEKRMLQEAVDALIDNSARQTKTVASTGKKRELKSLADILKGKQGRFRQNLLGKRIDYSGRSVIVVGPKLKLHQCGLPKRMALELFRPFVISRLIAGALVHNIRSANRFIESGRNEIWDILEDITRDAYVLLNRAPTLHRLGIQAFQPVLIEGKAIQIHPMVCTAFNADFDGDQMAVHVPLTEEAKIEARELMLATKNLLKPATGIPVATPNKDIAWGCYFMTMIKEPQGQMKFFASPTEARSALSHGLLSLQEKILVYLGSGRDKKRVETTIGRIILNNLFPEGIEFKNEILDAKKLAEIVRRVIEIHGLEVAARLLDDVKNLGFTYITKSGFSWSMSDLPDLAEKKHLVEDGERRIGEIEEQYQEGLLTSSERHSKIISIWTQVKNEISKMSKEKLDKNGSVFSMLDSGARGSPAQLTQMMGMKGLVSNPAGDIIELPVKKSFKEGLDVLEYFISTHGSRKGLADTALRTANAGYLTRRLVDVAQDMVIRDEDCGDTEGATLSAKESEGMGGNLASRALGRYVLEDITAPGAKKPLVRAGELIIEEVSRAIAKTDISEVRVRSVLTCKLGKGLCARCYGYDLSYNKPVKFGTAVGIIAAQSIGEPGTQLTMRTFHTGGVAGADITQGLPRVEELFEARSPKRRAFIAEFSGTIEVQEMERKTITDESGKVILETFPGQKIIRINYEEAKERKYKLSGGAKTLVKDGENIIMGTPLYRSGETEVVSEFDGLVKIGGKELTVVGKANKVCEYVVPPGVPVYVQTHDEVKAGDQLTDGDLDLQMLYKFRGRKAVQDYLLREVQSIYSSQGQKLNDKHIEVIIRQMFSRHYVIDSGDTDLLPGETVEKAQVFEEGMRAKKAKGKPAETQELLLGITKVALSTESFLSAASFIETARVLINAAVTGKVDRLEGLKENVIIGKLIPAGTGFRK